MTSEILPTFSKFEHFVDGQMFLCNPATEQECLNGCLFGSPRSKWPEVQQIKKNTAIFLYTIGEQPTLHGLFTAVGRPFLDMETSSFGGRFPSQVRVKRFFNFPPIPGCNVTQMFKGDRNRQRRLTRRQTHAILASVISYMYNRSDAGILERLSKQRKNVGAGVQMQSPLMSSGTPIYIYNPKNYLGSVARQVSFLPSNTNNCPKPSLTSDVQQFTFEKYLAPTLLPSDIPSCISGFVYRNESRKIESTGPSICQEVHSSPPFLYFPVLTHTSRPSPANSTKLVTKLFVGNLHKSITNDCLRACFSYFGKVLASGIENNAAGFSTGRGWVKFEKPIEAARAIERVNGMVIAGLKVVVCPWSEVIV